MIGMPGRAPSSRIDGPDAFAALVRPRRTLLRPVTPWTTDLHKVARDTDAIFPDWTSGWTASGAARIGPSSSGPAPAPSTPARARPGIPIEMAGATVIDVDADGKVTAWRDYLDTNEPTQQIQNGLERAIEGG